MTDQEPSQPKTFEEQRRLARTPREHAVIDCREQLAVDRIKGAGITQESRDRYNACMADVEVRFGAE